MVENLRVTNKTIALSTGIVVTLFSCVDQVKVSDAFVKSEMSLKLKQDYAPVNCAGMEISLASNVGTVALGSKASSTDGGMGSLLDTFVSSILKNTKPIDEDFSKVVDENFWDLV